MKRLFMGKKIKIIFQNNNKIILPVKSEPIIQKTYSIISNSLKQKE